MKKFELFPFATADELAQAAAGSWLNEMESAQRAGKPHCVALSGGRITKKFFAAVVEQARARKIGDGGMPSLPSNVHFFWADERCVPPNDPESNFKMADDLLFQPLKVPENQIHRIRGENSPAEAVKAAENEIRQVVVTGTPALDMIFLGMGEDGHVASLFPNAPGEVVNGPSSFLYIDNSPKPPPRRISLSYAAIAVARQVWVLISGAGKAKALRESLSISGKTPLARVIELRQKTAIFSQIEAEEKN